MPKQIWKVPVKFMFKVIVAGGRDFTDYALLQSTLLHLLSKQSDIEIDSGAANGADYLAIQFAAQHNIPVKKFPANWNLHGKSASYRRNLLMAGYADACVCFWDGKSKGTANMIRLSGLYKLQLRIVWYWFILLPQSRFRLLLKRVDSLRFSLIWFSFPKLTVYPRIVDPDPAGQVLSFQPVTILPWLCAFQFQPLAFGDLISTGFPFRYFFALILNKCVKIQC